MGKMAGGKLPGTVGQKRAAGATAAGKIVDFPCRGL